MLPFQRVKQPGTISPKIWHLCPTEKKMMQKRTTHRHDRRSSRIAVFGIARVEDTEQGRINAWVLHTLRLVIHPVSATCVVIAGLDAERTIFYGRAYFRSNQLSPLRAVAAGRPISEGTIRNIPRTRPPT